MVKELGVNMTSNELDAALDVMDPEKTGEVQFAQFMHW